MQKKLSVKLRELDIHKQLNIELHTDDTEFSLDKNDTIQAFVRTQYTPLINERLSVSLNTYRQVCSNGAIAAEANNRMFLNQNHDIGSTRDRLIAEHTKQLNWLKLIKPRILELTNIPLFSGSDSININEFIANWLRARKVKNSLSKIIIDEMAENYPSPTYYDFFNGITSARHRLKDPNPDNIRLLERLSGSLLSPAISGYHYTVKEFFSTEKH